MRRFTRGFTLAVVLAIFAPALAGCERSGKKEQNQEAPLSFSVEDNGVYFGAGLKGWALNSVSDEPRVHKFGKDGAQLFIQLRKYRSTTGKRPTQNELQAALADFCVVESCNTIPLKPGYWVNHYDTADGGSSVTNWDIATFSEQDDLLIAVVKLTPDAAKFHEELEHALEETLVVERR